ncbi:hypothetical protein HMPREF9120_00863 [Neisseria sp. oral taxon 020 str. F0370]|nr:hypothetical protein HMPREF9120_00863 [Neisseria sp. oral taxon 020 str. F0370]
MGSNKAILFSCCVQGSHWLSDGLYRAASVFKRKLPAVIQPPALILAVLRRQRRQGFAGAFLFAENIGALQGGVLQRGGVDLDVGRGEVVVFNQKLAQRGRVLQPAKIGDVFAGDDVYAAQFGGAGKIGQRTDAVHGFDKQVLQVRQRGDGAQAADFGRAPQLHIAQAGQTGERVKIADAAQLQGEALQFFGLGKEIQIADFVGNAAKMQGFQPGQSGNQLGQAFFAVADAEEFEFLQSGNGGKVEFGFVIVAPQQEFFQIGADVLQEIQVVQAVGREHEAFELGQAGECFKVGGGVFVVVFHPKVLQIGQMAQQGKVGLFLPIQAQGNMGVFGENPLVEFFQVIRADFGKAARGLHIGAFGKLRFPFGKFLFAEFGIAQINGFLVSDV